MANAFEETITKIVKKVVRTEYPQCCRPVMLRARITKIEPEGYKLVILDEELNRDSQYPEIPKVRSSSVYKKDDIVVITFINGKDAYIVGSA